MNSSLHVIISLPCLVCGLPPNNPSIRRTLANDGKLPNAKRLSVADEHDEIDEWYRGTCTIHYHYY